MATPNGIFVDFGSSSDNSDPGIRKLNNAAIRCAMFTSVFFSRPLKMTTVNAIAPATRIVTISTDNNSRGPRLLPSAPASFQSPAPRLRTSTQGKSNPNPNAAPNSALNNPGQRYRIVLTTTPAAKPETVSQFGIRR